MTVYRNVVEFSRPGTLTSYHVFYTTEPVSKEAPELQGRDLLLLVSQNVRTGEPLFNGPEFQFGIEHLQRISDFGSVSAATTTRLDIFYGVIDFLAMAISTRDTPSVAVCKGVSFHAYGSRGIAKYASRFGNVVMVYQIYKYLVDALSIPDAARLETYSYTVGDFRRAIRGTERFSFELPLDL